ncbi:MAG TPA: insulinase family protein [Kofleriaceae bacterium]|nr:insulinase family protein [Kofleriaceae bacterium]
MKKTLVGTAALLLLGATACNVSTPSFTFKYAEKRGRLNSNGLRFVIIPDSSTQLAEVDVRYQVGSREDPIGKAGIAHVVEHLMFQLRPPVVNDAGEIVAAETPPMMQQINDKTTFFNAYTNWDTTHYQNTAMADRVEELLAIESQRMLLKCQTVSEEEFLREREVVRNEIRQRGGTAEGQVPQLVMSSMYPKGHAYERMIGGDDAQLTSITLKDVCDFMDKYYTPDNATVIVAGGIDVDKTINAISGLYGNINLDPTGKKINITAPRKEVEPIKITPTKEVIDLDIEKPMLAVSWALPPANTPEGEAAQYGINSVFFRTASKAQQYDFATSVSPAILGGQLAPIFTLIIELKSMKNYDEAIEFVRKAAKSAYRGFDEGSKEQIEEGQNVAKADFIAGLEPLASRTNLIGDEVQFNTKFDFDSSDVYMFKLLDKYGQFDGEKVASAVKRAIDPNKMRIVVFKPNKEGIKGDVRAKVKFEQKSHDSREVVDVDPAEAKKPIKLQKDIKGLSAAQRFTLGNGMNVVLLPVKSMPLVAANLMFNNAGDAATPNEPAVASAAARFLALPLDAEAFQRTGIGVRCRSDEDMAVCSTHGINIYLDLMLNGLDRLIVAGEYNQSQIEGYQKNLKNNYDRAAIESDEFTRQMQSALFGPDHPYTKTAIETPEFASKLSKDRLDSFRRANYVAGNATLVVVGDFDPVQAEKQVRSVFGGWGKGTPAPAMNTAQYQRSGPAFIGVIAKEEPQLQVAIAYPSPAGLDGQGGARRVLTEMLNLRMGDVRFKLGATYGVYARLASHEGPSNYEMGGTVDAPRAGEAIKAMRNGVNMLRSDDSFSPVEFVRARKKVLQSLLGLSTVTQELAMRLTSMSKFGLAPTYYNTLLQQVAAASPILLKSMVASELNPNNEVVVVKGTREQLEKAFKDAGITDVKYVEPKLK